jgi:hypothetical protein
MTRTQPKFVCRLKWAGAVRNAGLALLFLVCVAGPCRAYSVLTHEEVVDLLWPDQIGPLLKQRFPAATEENMRGPMLTPTVGASCKTWGTTPSATTFSDLVH